MNEPVTPPIRPSSETRLRESGPPGAFARIFLEGLAKYDRPSGRDVGTPTEEAATNLAQRSAPAQAVHGLDLRSPRAIAETVAITAGLPALGFLLDRSDPFLLQHGFSWLILAPVLVALRHGLTLGLSSAVALDLALVIGWRTHVLGFEGFPGGPFVGLIAVAMLVGQFSDVWKREIVRLDAGFGVLRKQNNELSRSHFLLELSHDRLDEQVGRTSGSLREAIAAVREIAGKEASPSYATLGDAMMEVLGAYCMLEVGQLHVVDDGALGKAVASLGRPRTTSAQDPLVVEALRSGRLTYVPAASCSRRGDEMGDSPLLAAVPFVDTAGRTSALLCVHAMPFISFEKRNLEAMATLAGHFADLATKDAGTADAHRGRLDAFEVALKRAVRDLREQRIPSVVAFVWIRRGAAMSDLVDTMLGDALRELELPYVARDPSGNSFVYVLLPAADEQAARDLEQRLEVAAQSSRRTSLAGLGASFSHHVLEPTDSMLGLFRLFATRAHQQVARHDRVRAE
jgi:polysaccharide biosynthesis protein PelD